MTERDDRTGLLRRRGVRALALGTAFAIGAALAAGVAAAPAQAAANICNIKCDSTDAAQAGSMRTGDTKDIDGRTLKLVFDDNSAMGFGTIEGSSAGDQVWVDRSFDGGRSWEQLGVTTNPGGVGGWRTQMYNLDDWNNAGVGALRTCGKKSGGAIACTQWGRVTWNSGGRVNAAATSLMMYYNRSINLFQTSYDSSNGPGWGSAVSMTSLIRSIKATGMTSYSYAISRTFEAYKNASNGSGNTGFKNKYSDDAGWWVMAWLDAYDLTGESKYLDAAKSGAAYMKTFWTSTCGGGLKWRSDDPGKVTISNTLYIQANAALALRVPTAQKQTYVTEAVNTWNWLKASALTRGDNRFWDGLNSDCTASTSGLPYSYHNGTAVSGLTSLAQYYDSVGDSSKRDTYRNLAQDFANGITAKNGDFTDGNGIMRDPAEGWDNCTNDGAYFKAAAARGLDELDRTLPSRPYRSYLQANADSAYNSGARNKLDQYSIKWTSWTQGEGEGCQASALALLAAAN